MGIHWGEGNSEMNAQDFQKRWEEFEKRPFPDGHRSKTFQGRSLTLMFSEIGGYVLGFSQTQQLGGRQLMDANAISKILEEAIPELEGEGKEFFSDLHKLLQDLLEAAPEYEGFM